MPIDRDTGERLRSLYAADGGVRTVFSEKVSDYTASRPGYPDGLYQELTDRCAPLADVTVADIGAGTGLLTRGLLDKGYRVIAVEPNAEMRRAADYFLQGESRYRSVEGCAEVMPLATGSIDLITAAQAFHWFENDRAMPEFLRVLSPQGQVALIWNDRVLEDPLHVALDKIFAEFGGAKREALVAHENRSDVPRFFGSGRLENFAWPHVHYLEESGLLSLIFSRSYIPGRDTGKGREIAERAREVFSRFATKGRVAVRYLTVAMLGRPA